MKTNGISFKHNDTAIPFKLIFMFYFHFSTTGKFSNNGEMKFIYIKN